MWFSFFVLYLQKKLRIMGYLVLKNNGVLSLLDLLTIGGSEKRGNDSLIGTFASGLKYAIAIALREEVELKIISGGIQYTFSSTVEVDKRTEKAKSVIVVEEFIEETGEVFKHTTAFSTEFGFDWIPTHFIREFYANTLDNQGVVEFDGDFDSSFETNVLIDNTHPLVEGVILNWNDYFLESSDVLFEHHNVKVRKNKSKNQLFSVYKQGIQVFASDLKSKYSYDVNNADIDERRELRNVSWVKVDISYAIRGCQDVGFIEDFLLNLEEGYEDETLLESGYFSKEWVEVVNNLQEKEKLEHLPKKVVAILSEDYRFNMKSRKLAVNDDYYASKVMVDIVKKDVVEEGNLSFEELVFKLAEECKFKLDFPIKESIVNHKNKALADKMKKVIYVDKEFKKEDMWELVREQYRLNDGNVFQDLLDALK